MEHQEQFTSRPSWSVVKEQLMFVLDVEHGLRDEMYNTGILNDELFESLSEVVNKTKVKLFLDELERMSGENQNKFLLALIKTQQEHVKNLICHNGIRPEIRADVWPIYVLDRCRKIQENWSLLLEFTDSFYGLLDEMLALNCVSHLHIEVIDDHKSSSRRNRELYGILKQRSIIDYFNFICCLLKTKQTHVASILEPGSVEVIVQPLSEACRNIMQRNWSALVENIDLSQKLLSALFANDCITQRQKEAVEFAGVNSERVKRLLEIIRRGSQQCFEDFKKSLERAGQEQLCQILMDDVIVPHMDAHVIGPGNLKEIDRNVVDRLREILLNMPSEDIVPEDAQIRDLLQQPGVQLFALQAGHSIRMFFICHSEADVQKLFELYSNGKLKAVTQQLFRLSLGNNGGQELVVDRLDWNQSDYDRCLQFYTSLHRSPEERTTQTADSEVTCSVCLETFDNPRSLPCTHTFCYRCLSRQLSNDNNPVGRIACPMCRRLCDVPSDGIDGFIHRSSTQCFQLRIKYEDTISALKRQVRELQKKQPEWPAAGSDLSQASGSDAAGDVTSKDLSSSKRWMADQKVTQVFTATEGDGSVDGLAVLGGHLFLVRSWPRIRHVEVYNSTDYAFERFIELNEHGGDEAHGVTSCETNWCLYVSDWRKSDPFGFVHRVELKDNFDVSKWRVKSGEPRGLSVTGRGNLLVTCLNVTTNRDDEGDKQDKLIEYTTHGQIVNVIYLHDDIVYPRHAVELRSGQFVVSHGWGSVHRVCFVDSDGIITSSYGNERGSDRGQLNEPEHLAVDERDGSIFVADKCNNRIVVLDRTLKRLDDLDVFVGSDLSRPSALCLDLRCCRLFVGESNKFNRVLVVDI